MGSCDWKTLIPIRAIDSEMSTDQMNEISAEANRIGFFTMNDKYDASVSDVPSCITMIVGENGRKKVIDRFDGPESLHAFETYLDRVIAQLKWNPSK